MEYRHLGSSGLVVSALGLGTNNFGGRADEETSIRVLHKALDIGVNCIDTANTYTGTRSEEIIGKGLKGKRDKAIIATKFGIPMGQGPNEGGGSRQHMMVQVEDSLRRLQTDYIDLYQLHKPDPNTPIEETLRALDDLVHQGKVRYIGTTSFAGWQLVEAFLTAKSLGLSHFVSEQPYYNLLKRGVEKELLPACRAYGVGVIPYFPLESGFLTGKYRPGEAPPKGTRLSHNLPYTQGLLSERNFEILGNLEAFAQERDRTVGELAIAWLLSNPSVSTVIAGATSPEQVADNARGVGWQLTPEEMQSIDEIVPVG